jgi:CRISPR-associated protein Csb2
LGEAKEGQLMTVDINVCYPFGYVHATPWGTHVNEGAIEWPLSPWRLLRALVATWQTRCQELPAGTVTSLLSSLAVAPAIRVSPRTEASVRSYLPSEQHHRGMSGDTDLAIDAFVAVAPGRGISYQWDVDLDVNARRALGEIVESLPYLGRAESVCDADASFGAVDSTGWQLPLPDSEGLGVRTLVPATPLDLDDLCVSISAMRRAGRLHPPGARWMRYRIDDPMTEQPAHYWTPQPRLVKGVRLVLSGRARVSIRRTLLVAEAMRRAGQSQYGSAHAGGSSEVLAGKDHAATPLLGHTHAHWLPLDLDGDRLLDSLLVWADRGFAEDDIRALGNVRRLRFHPDEGMRSVPSLAVALESADELRELDLGPVVGPAMSWRSITPFLPQRHLHPRRQSREAFLFDCLRRELAARGLPEPVSIKEDRETNWGSFRRHRLDENLRAARMGVGFVIHFDRPVDGPLCLGRLSHFGMGRFEACPT